MLVVVGASVAGIRAVEAARATGWTGPITVIGAETARPYDRTALTKQLLAADGPAEPPPLRSEESLRELGAELRLGVQATGLDLVERRLLTDHGPMEYDALVVATGARSRRLPGVSGASGVHAVRSLDESYALRSGLGAARRVLVVGAGFLGAEVATAARDRGLQVTVVEAAAQPLGRAAGPEAGAMLSRLHLAGGVDLRLGHAVDGVAQRARGPVVVRVAAATGARTEMEADLVVVAIGAVPATSWLGDALALDPRTGAIACDPTLATSAPGVWAAGDVASVSGEISQHWTTAADQGAVAGANAAGDSRVHDGAIFAWSHWYGHRVQCIGSLAAGEETLLDDGLVVCHRAGILVGALGIDRPREIARLRRELGLRAVPA